MRAATVLVICIFLGPSGLRAAEPVVQLTDKQRAVVKTAPVLERVFYQEKEAIGSIDFNEDLTVPVFPHYQGKIQITFATLGDEVKRGQPLYSIESPDLIQAESTLIGAAAAMALTTAALERARHLFDIQGIALKDLEQAVSDQQTAEGAYRAARDGVRVFGKSDAEIDRMVATRKIDPSLMVLSPVGGRVTARNAQPGLFVSPGALPAPFTVADLSTMWMLANVIESDIALLRVGQDVRVSTIAFPGREFLGRITRIGSSVDANTHRLTIRSEVVDPAHELRSGMLASFVIRTGSPIKSPALPAAAVVREGDGTTTAWFTTDDHRFVQRVIKLGMDRDGYEQVLEGAKAGEVSVSEGAIFLSNMLATGQPS